MPFSLENYGGVPEAEVDFLMRLLREYLKREMPSIHKNNIRFMVIGRLSQLPESVRKDVADAMRLTERNTGMKLIVALNYGARAELKVDVVQRFASLEGARSNGHAGQSGDHRR